MKNMLVCLGVLRVSFLGERVCMEGFCGVCGLFFILCVGGGDASGVLFCFGFFFPKRKGLLWNFSFVCLFALKFGEMMIPPTSFKSSGYTNMS